jgi:hypothetical protein
VIPQCLKPAAILETVSVALCTTMLLLNSCGIRGEIIICRHGECVISRAVNLIFLRSALTSKVEVKTFFKLKGCCRSSTTRFKAVVEENDSVPLKVKKAVGQKNIRIREQHLFWLTNWAFFCCVVSCRRAVLPFLKRSTIR